MDHYGAVLESGELKLPSIARIVTQPLTEVSTLRGREKKSMVTKKKSSSKKKSSAKYGKAAGKSVKSAMHREKRGTLRSGKGGKGGKVTSRKQAIAIGLSEARKKGAKVPEKKASQAH